MRNKGKNRAANRYGFFLVYPEAEMSSHPSFSLLDFSSWASRVFPSCSNSPMIPSLCLKWFFYICHAGQPKNHRKEYPSFLHVLICLDARRRGLGADSKKLANTISSVTYVSIPFSWCNYPCSEKVDLGGWFFQTRAQIKYSSLWNAVHLSQIKTPCSNCKGRASK